MSLPSFPHGTSSHCRIVGKGDEVGAGETDGAEEGHSPQRPKGSAICIEFEGIHSSTEPKLVSAQKRMPSNSSPHGITGSHPSKGPMGAALGATENEGATEGSGREDGTSLGALVGHGPQLPNGKA
jgi:hypothetical protein